MHIQSLLSGYAPDIIICDGNNAVYQKCTDKDKTYK